MTTKIRGAQINDLIAGAGLIMTSGVLIANVDGISISNSVITDTLSVIASGIDHGSISGLGDPADHSWASLVDGTRAFTNTVSGVTPTIAGHLATKGYVDGLVASGVISHATLSGLSADDHTQYILADGTRAFTGTVSGVGMTLTAGDFKIFSTPGTGDVSGITAGGTTSATFGQAVYLNASGAYVAAKADAEATMPAVALSTGAGNEVITHGFVKSGSWTAGGLIYVSDATAGALTQSVPTASGSQVQVVGVATSTDTFFFNPDLTFMELGDPPYYTKLELTSSGVLDVRYYTETEIDGMIAGVSGSIITDHGALTGLGDSIDHTWATLVDGTRAFSGTVSGVTPTQNAHLTTKLYVDTGDAATLSGANAYTDAVSGTLNTANIWESVDTPTVQIRPKAAYMGQAIYTSGNVTIGGDLTVTGTLFYTDTEIVQVSDNTIIVNYGEAGAGVTKRYAGLEVDRGSEVDYWLVFDENSDNFRIGVSGVQSSFNSYPLQPVATREDAPVNTRVAWWDAPNYTFRTQGADYITIGSGIGSITTVINNVTEVTVSSGGLALKTGGDVNEIVTTITSSSTDDQLATAQAIYEYVDSISGTVIHNELEGLQGGDTSNRWHLDANTYNAFSSNGTTLFIYDNVDIDGNVNVSGTFSFDNDVTVDQILDSSDAPLTPANTDDQLVTAKLMYDFINTVSGSISGSISAVDHNDLNGLQGGDISNRWHLNSTAYTALSGTDGTDISNWDAYINSTWDTTTNNSSNWDAAYGWGNHASGGYYVLATHTLDNVTDGTNYEKVAANQLNSGIYIDATTSTKGIASFDTDHFVVASGAVTIKGASIESGDLKIENSATDGYFLQATSSGMKWVDSTASGVVEGDYRLENESSNCTGGTTVFTLDVTPISNSLQVYLNGLLQEKGSGKDYEHTGTTVTFGIAPLSGDILLINYVKQS